MVNVAVYFECTFNDGLIRLVSVCVCVSRCKLVLEAIWHQNADLTWTSNHDEPIF